MSCDLLFYGRSKSVLLLISLVPYYTTGQKVGEVNKPSSLLLTDLKSFTATKKIVHTRHRQLLYNQTAIFQGF